MSTEDRNGNGAGTSVGTTPALGPPIKTARILQQELAWQNGCGGHVMWDLYTSEDMDSLKEKLEFLIPNAQRDTIAIDNDNTLNEDEKIKKIAEDLTRVKKHNQKMEEIRKPLLENIWAQRKFSGGSLFSSIIYVILTPKRCDDNISLTRSEHSTDCTLHPIIRIRRCIYGNNSENCCMIFVDENARVYQNWKEYLEDNQLSAGVIVVPKNGIYTFDADKKVILECFETPACSIGTAVIRAADIGTSVAGFGAAAIPAAALLVPVAAPLLVGAAVVAVGSGIYSIGRSLHNLFDRGSHEQSISVADRQARGSWLGIASGGIALGASGATRVLSQYAAAGREVSTLLQTTVNGMNISSIVISGVGVGNGALEIILKYQDDDDISALDVVQLSASLVLFTHSVYNFQLASSIIRTNQKATIADFKNDLSRAQRKMFIKMEKETIRIQGETNGRADIIRSLKKIPNKQYFNDIYKINKELNKQNIRPSFKDGEVLLNGDIAVDANTLRQNVQHNVGDNILGNVNSPIPQSFPVDANGNNFTFTDIPFNARVAFKIAQIVTRSIHDYYILNKGDLQNCISDMFEKLSDEVVDYLLELADEFYLEYREVFQMELQRVLPYEEILWDLFKITLTLPKIDKTWLKTNCKLILNELKQKYIKYINVMHSGKRVQCKKCIGYYTISNI